MATEHEKLRDERDASEATVLELMRRIHQAEAERSVIQVRLDAALEENAGLFDKIGKTDRLTMLRAQAVAVAEDRTRERDQLRAAMPAGLAFELLVSQIRRLRRTPCETMAFDPASGPAEMVKALRRELAELDAEQTGSIAWKREALDVFTCALHLLIAADMLVDVSVAEQAAKLGARLDHVDRGGTWADAKRLETADPADRVWPATQVPPSIIGMLVDVTKPDGCISRGLTVVEVGSELVLGTKHDGPWVITRDDYTVRCSSEEWMERNAKLSNARAGIRPATNIDGEICSDCRGTGLRSVFYRTDGRIDDEPCDHCKGSGMI